MTNIITNTKNKVILIFAITLLLCSACLIFTIIWTKKRLNDANDLEQLYIIAQDSLKITRNKLNQEQATTSVLTAEHTYVIEKLKTKDKDILRLQSLIYTYEEQIGDLNTALIFGNQTITTLEDSIKNIITGYSEIIDNYGTITKYPIYQREFNREWDSGKITVGFDTLNLLLKIRNSYNVTIGEEKASPFKKKVYATITNLNPNTETSTIKVYQKEYVKDKTFRKVTTTGLIMGTGGLILGLLIK